MDTVDTTPYIASTSSWSTSFTSLREDREGTSFPVRSPHERETRFVNKDFGVVLFLNNVRDDFCACSLTSWQSGLISHVEMARME